MRRVSDPTRTGYTAHVWPYEYGWAWKIYKGHDPNVAPIATGYRRLKHKARRDAKRAAQKRWHVEEIERRRARDSGPETFEVWSP